MEGAEDARVRILVNGLAREVPEGTTLEALLLRDGEPLRHVLVEVNGEYLAKGAYASRVLREGDRIEVILPAFGG